MLTPNGIQPQAKKVETIHQIAESRNKKELRRFLGMISHFREIVPYKSALTAKLNRLPYNASWVFCDHPHGPQEFSLPAGVITSSKALEVAAPGMPPFTAVRPRRSKHWCRCRLRYDYVKQATVDELLSVEEEEVAIDGAVLKKKHQLADLTTKAVIPRLAQSAADPGYSLHAALGAVLVYTKKRVVSPASLRNYIVELYHEHLLHRGAE
ncbi:hypothetical protein ON010_g2473 [Phytophthora cinnamomi]|nr:hypothetical protein ON010_g2473 [Phytophthora cinnamomi]